MEENLPYQMGIQEKYEVQQVKSRNSKLDMVAKGYSQVKGVDFGEIFSLLQN
jgi:hypothetical protein